MHMNYDWLRSNNRHPSEEDILTTWALNKATHFSLTIMQIELINRRFQPLTTPGRIPVAGGWIGTSHCYFLV